MTLKGQHLKNQKWISAVEPLGPLPLFCPSLCLPPLIADGQIHLSSKRRLGTIDASFSNVIPPWFPFSKPFALGEAQCPWGIQYSTKRQTVPTRCLFSIWTIVLRIYRTATPCNVYEYPASSTPGWLLQCKHLIYKREKCDFRGKLKSRHWEGID